MYLLPSFTFWKPKKVFDIQNIYWIWFREFFGKPSMPNAPLDSLPKFLLRFNISTKKQQNGLEFVLSIPHAKKITNWRTGALHHIVARGTARTKIFLDDTDQNNFLKRLGERNRVNPRSLLCYWAVRELGISMAELSRRCGLWLSGLSQLVKRGEELVQDKGYRLIDL